MSLQVDRAEAEARRCEELILLLDDPEAASDPALHIDICWTIRSLRQYRDEGVEFYSPPRTRTKLERFGR
jgi:hypothetical protein